MKSEEKKDSIQVGNSNKDIATAKVGDFIVRDNGDVVYLKQGDIDYAKAKLSEENQTKSDSILNTSEQKDEIINVTPQYHTTYGTTPRIEDIEDELEKMNAEENTNQAEIQESDEKKKLKKIHHYSLGVRGAVIVGGSLSLGIVINENNFFDSGISIKYGVGTGVEVGIDSIITNYFDHFVEKSFEVAANSINFDYPTSSYDLEGTTVTTYVSAGVGISHNIYNQNGINGIEFGSVDGGVYIENTKVLTLSEIANGFTNFGNSIKNVFSNIWGF